MKRHLSLFAALGLCLSASTATAYAQQVQADTGGVAIGGSVTGSTINIGIPQAKVDELVRDAKQPLEELTAQQRENIALLKEKLDLNLGQVRAALNIVGENSISPANLGAKLVEIAERFKELQATASAQPGDSPAIVSLKAEAQRAIEAGELTKADALLADVEAEQRRALDRLAVNAAETSARRGEIALTRLRYAEAAKHFANAAAVFPPNSEHENKRIAYLQREANALYRQGNELGDNRALLAAIEQYKRLIELRPREGEPLGWAMAQNNLGVALRSLGERERGTAKLEEAVIAYREALTERTRERAPPQWAQTQHNLGVVLFRLGERESGTARLEEAVICFREALKERTRESAPLDWASSQSNLGFALFRLGERESGTARLEEAVVAYREVLKEITREKSPLGWGQTQNDLGIALKVLGEREQGTTKFEQAVATLHEALKERTRERLPLEWARTQHNLGNALQALAYRERESGTARLEEAVIAYREALTERTRERVPLEWAWSQNNLGFVLFRLGERESGTARLEEAVIAYREVLKEQTRERVPLEWARTQHNLGNVLKALGDRESGTAKLEEAVGAYRDALKERTRERVPLDWARTFGDQGVALIIFARRRGDAPMAEIALNQINAAFETMRDGGDALRANYYQNQLPNARTLVTRLRGQ